MRHSDGELFRVFHTLEIHGLPDYTFRLSAACVANVIAASSARCKSPSRLVQEAFLV